MSVKHIIALFSLMELVRNKENCPTDLNKFENKWNETKKIVFIRNAYSNYAKETF